jgi:hypothetical protein
MTISRSNLRFFKTADGLGGPITSSPADDLFPNVKGIEAEKGITDYACFYFANLDDDPDGLMSPHLWFESSSGASTVTLGLDPGGKNATAQVIPSRFDAPLGVVFSEPESELSSIWLSGDPYKQDDKIAIWAKRVVPKGAPIGSEGFSVKVRGESY